MADFDYKIVTIAKQGMERRPMRIALAFCLSIGLGFTNTKGQDLVTPDFESACVEVPAMARFVFESKIYARDFANRARVLDTLVCIAGKSGSNFYAGCAIRALCELVVDRQELEEFLLRIVVEDNIALSTRELACQMTMYVAGDAARKVFRQRVASGFPSSMRMPEALALVELGDMEFASFLEDKLAPWTGEERDRSAAADLLSRIRLQTDPARVLSECQANNWGDEPAWMIRQALRHGAAVSEIREAVLPVLRGDLSRFSTTRRYAFIRLLDQTGIIRDVDLADLPGATQVIFQKARNVRSEGICPPGAKRHEELRNAFYRLTASTDRQE